MPSLEERYREAYKKAEQLIEKFNDFDHTVNSINFNDMASMKDNSYFSLYPGIIGWKNPTL